MTVRLDVLELEFQRRLHLQIGRRRDLRVWRQNVGRVLVRDEVGRARRVFTAGPPKGASDLSGIVIPEGWRFECEMKSATGERSEDQVRWGEFMQRSGAVYLQVGYDPALTLPQNLARAVGLIDEAIAARRRRGAA